MNNRRWSYALIVVFLSSVVSQAQGVKPAGQLVPPSLKLNNDEKLFDSVAAKFETLAKNCKRFTVAVTSNWTSTDGTRTTKGTNLFRVVSQVNGRILIEAGSKETGPAQFICASDGRTLTRLHRSTGLYTQQPVVNLYQQLPNDPMTEQVLSQSSVDFLIRPDFRANLIDQIAGVRKVGVETVDGKEAIHFQLKLKDDSQRAKSDRRIDAWFLTGDRPLLIRMVNYLVIPIVGRPPFQLTTDNHFQWEIGDALSDDVFAINLPQGARKVTDLLSALRDGDVSQLVGKPAPNFALSDMNGQAIQLQDRLGKSPVVLIFWASWCAPSTNSMASLNQFVDEARSVGVQVYAINLGEKREVVEKSVRDRQYKGTVLLDPDTTTLKSYKIGSIPLTVLIDKEGNVASYFLGSTPQVRTEIRQALKKMVGGGR